LNKVSKILIGLLFFLSAVDLIVTYIFLKLGHIETNPLFASNPGLLIPAKIVVITLITAITIFAEYKIGEWATLFPASGSAAAGIVVIHNVLLLGAIS